MDKVLIVGSGASSVHFALSVLEKGYEVTLLDVGYEKPEDLCPDESIDGLKESLDDPVDYFLGDRFESFIPPDYDAEYYGFPPDKNYVFTKPESFKFNSSGFAPLFSFARGGLAEVWTGGVYPLNDHELSDFPFSFNDLLPYYSKVAARIGITGIEDDLSFSFPWHEGLEQPLNLDYHSELLLTDYERKKEFLNKSLEFHMGRSRVAVLSSDKGERERCTYCGRCLWGCPNGAFYTPSLSLKECMKYENFKYVPGMYVKYFKYDSDNRITSVIAESVEEGSIREFTVEKLVLGAGTASSSRIFMESIYLNTGEVVKLTGLMDNRQILAPFINLKMIGNSYDPENYQYHQVAFGITNRNPKEHIHGQVTTLKSALIHPIIQSLPFDLKTSVYAFRNLHPALGVLNLNFHDTRCDNNFMSLNVDEDRSNPSLVINYETVSGEKNMMNDAMNTLKKAFMKLGCVVPTGMAHIRPMGASVHYAGTIPMSDGNASFTATDQCRSNDFRNLYFIDGTTFPFLPAKQLTFTMMSNAVRVAEQAF